MGNELTVKNPKLPLKAYPKQTREEQLDKFLQWVTNLLGLRGEESAKRMVIAIPAIEKKFWSLGMDDIKKAFEMYALGELETKPIPNYFDTILVGQVFNDYKKHQRSSEKEPFDESRYKDVQDYIHVVCAYDHYISTGIIGDESVWIYTYLTDVKKHVSFDVETRQDVYYRHYEKLPKDEAILKSKIELLSGYFDKIKSKGLHIKNILETQPSTNTDNQ